MKKIIYKSLLIIALAVLPMTIFAQGEPVTTNYWTIGIEGGATQLFGDNTQWNFDQTSWNVGMFFGYTIKNQIYMYGNLGYSNLKGENKDFFTIDECNLLHANLNVGYDVLQLFRLNPHRKVAIVPHWGFGVLQHKTTAKLANGTEIKTGYSDAHKGKGIGGRRNVFQNAFGLNFIFHITKHFQANLDFVGYKTDSDYLDAIGGANHNKHNDWYGHANIGLAYNFGIKEKKPCPDCPPCEPDQDAIDQAIKDAIEKYKADNPCPECPKCPEPEVIPFKNIDLKLNFKVGSSKVEDNEASRKEIKEISDDIDNGVQFSAIKVSGYASPEGDDEQNIELSENRANATIEYIQENLGDQVKDVEFQAKGMGSDWEGFFEALENSTISNKDEIAKSIKEAEDPTAELNKMRVRYPEIENLLKNLRRTRVSYIE